MYSATLVEWAENLSECEMQLMCIRAAKAHTVKFSNPDTIGMEWARTLRNQGYNRLGPYARNYIAHRYLEYCESSHVTRKIPVR